MVLALSQVSVVVLVVAASAVTEEVQADMEVPVVVASTAMGEIQHLTVLQAAVAVVLMVEVLAHLEVAAVLETMALG